MTTRSVPAGSAGSACQTKLGSVPDTSFSVRAMSRSRLMPGKTTTADFIGSNSLWTLLALRSAAGRRRRALLDLHEVDELVHRRLGELFVPGRGLHADHQRTGEDDRRLHIGRGAALEKLAFVDDRRIALQRRGLGTDGLDLLGAIRQDFARGAGGADALGQLLFGELLQRLGIGMQR